MENKFDVSPDNRTSVCTFKFLKEHIELVKLPSSRWSFSKGCAFCGFQKVERNGIVRKRVAVIPEFDIKIFIDDNVIPFSEFIRVMDIKEFGTLLEIVDEHP